MGFRVVGLGFRAQGSRFNGLKPDIAILRLRLLVYRFFFKKHRFFRKKLCSCSSSIFHPWLFDCSWFVVTLSIDFSLEILPRILVVAIISAVARLALVCFNTCRFYGLGTR